MASEYAVLGPHPGVTITGPHQVGVGFSGHRGLVREIGGRTERCDAGPGAVYVTGPSPITWRESRALEPFWPPRCGMVWLFWSELLIGMLAWLWRG